MLIMLFFIFIVRVFLFEVFVMFCDVLELVFLLILEILLYCYVFIKDKYIVVFGYIFIFFVGVYRIFYFVLNYISDSFLLFSLGGFFII